MRENHGTFSRKNSDSLSCSVTYFPNFVIRSFHEIFVTFWQQTFQFRKTFLKSSQFLFTNNQTRGFSRIFQFLQVFEI